MLVSLFNEVVGFKDLQYYLKRDSNTGLSRDYSEIYKNNGFYREIDPIRYLSKNILELLTKCGGHEYNAITEFRSASSSYQDPNLGITVG